jgi:hypothetical protein
MVVADALVVQLAVAMLDWPCQHDNAFAAHRNSFAVDDSYLWRLFATNTKEPMLTESTRTILFATCIL